MRASDPGTQPRTLEDLLAGSSEARAVLDAIFSSIPSGLTIASAPNVEILRVTDTGAPIVKRSRSVLALSLQSK